MSNPVVTINGRIGTDPDFKEFGDNRAIKFRVITSDRRRNESGEWEDKDTSGWTVSAWNNLCDNSKKVLKKGQEVIVIGTMTEDSWTDSSGVNRKSVEIKATNIAVTTFSLSKE